MVCAGLKHTLHTIAHCHQVNQTQSASSLTVASTHMTSQLTHARQYTVQDTFQPQDKEGLYMRYSDARERGKTNVPFVRRVHITVSPPTPTPTSITQAAYARKLQHAYLHGHRAVCDLGTLCGLVCSSHVTRGHRIPGAPCAWAGGCDARSSFNPPT